MARCSRESKDLHSGLWPPDLDPGWEDQEQEDYHHCTAFIVQVVDTTGAGDCYTGAYAVALLEGLEGREAMAFAGANDKDTVSFAVP